MYKGAICLGAREQESSVVFRPEICHGVSGGGRSLDRSPFRERISRARSAVVGEKIKDS